MAYREAFQYPLSNWLNPLNWANWEGPEDTDRIIREVMRAIAGQDALPHRGDGPPRIRPGEQRTEIDLSIPLPAAPLETPGSMHPKSRYYVRRRADLTAGNAIEREGETITIKGARQMGKSSLLMNVIDAAKKAGKRVVFLDFQQFEGATLEDPDLFFRSFCSWISVELELENQVDKHWSKDLGNPSCCAQYMSRYILKQINSQLVIAMDEVERIFDTRFRNDFFGMLRSWHNRRANPTQPIWRKLDLVLVTSTEPYMFIEDLTQSPFNVGEIIELTDFTLEDVACLNRQHGTPLTPEQERALFELVGGHPYLVRRAFYLVKTGLASATELFEHAVKDRGPFGDHLRGFLLRLHGNPSLIAGLKEVLEHHTCRDLKIYFRLRGAGLVHRNKDIVLPRCALYDRYFRERLNG